MRIGIIGLGGVSRHYVRAIGDSLVAVCDVRRDRLEAFARDGVSAYVDASQLLRDPGVDAVVIDTPVPSHPELCREALEQGLHVCVEKPLAVTTSEARDLLDLANERERILFTAFHRRYNARLPRRDALPSGPPSSIRSWYLENIVEHAEDLGWYARPAAEGGGCIVDNGPNAFDVVRHLFGAPTVESAAVARSEEGVDERAVVRGRIGETEVTIALDWAYDGEEKGMSARWGDHEITVDFLEGYSGFKASLDHEYVGVLDDFRSCIEHGVQDAHGLAATAWTEAVLGIAHEPEPAVASRSEQA